MIPRVVTSLALGLFCALGGWGRRVAEAGVPAPMTVAVRSAGRPLAIPSADSGQDIRDIHGPIAIPQRRSAWWYLAGGAVAAAAVIGLILYTRRRRPLVPPNERALRALAEAGALVEGDPRQFSFAVSEIVRLYVEEAFRVRAAHRTTEELLADLMLDRSPVALHRTALGEFLRYCDLAKFAGWSLSRADMAAMLASAETFILATATPASPEHVRKAAIRGEGIA
jgi:hypothetical protein